MTCPNCGLENQSGAIAVGDAVVIACAVSRYAGVTGVVREIETHSAYAMVDMPQGTELRIERIEANAILRGLTATSRKRFTGDPQWFPLGWLRRTDGG